jgi:hypothetical protein
MADDVVPEVGMPVQEFISRLGYNMSAYRNARKITQRDFIKLGVENLDKKISKHALTILEGGELARLLEIAVYAFEVEISDLLHPPSKEYVEKYNPPVPYELRKSRALPPEVKAARAAERAAAKKAEKEERTAAEGEAEKKESSYNTYHVHSVAPETITEVAMDFWDYVDGHMKSRDYPDGWTDQQAREVISMLFDDLT